MEGRATGFHITSSQFAAKKNKHDDDWTWTFHTQLVMPGSSAAVLLAAVCLCTHEVAATDVGGFPLPRITEYRSQAGLLSVTLTADVTRLGAGLLGEGLHPLAWNRRSFNGAPTGPTLRVRPGGGMHAHGPLCNRVLPSLWFLVGCSPELC